MIDNATLKMQFLFSLRKAGVVDKKVLDAMERVDRKNFVKGVFSEKAYDDTPLPIACGKTISQPTVVGLMKYLGKNELTLEVEEEFYPHLSMEDLPNQLVDAKLVIYKL